MTARWSAGRSASIASIDEDDVRERVNLGVEVGDHPRRGVGGDCSFFVCAQLCEMLLDCGPGRTGPVGRRSILRTGIGSGSVGRRL